MPNILEPNMPNAQSAFIDCLAEIVSKKSEGNS